MTLTDRKVDFLGGQIKALMYFANVIIATHPAPALLKEHFEAAELVGQAVSGADTVSEDFLMGMADVNRGIGAAMKIANEPRSTDDGTRK